MDILLSIFCSWHNGQLAKQKGQKVSKWFLLTLLAFFLSYMIGGVTLVGILYKGTYTTGAIVEYLQGNPLLVVTIMFFGLGGYLLVRRTLEKMPDVKKEG